MIRRDLDTASDHIAGPIHPEEYFISNAGTERFVLLQIL
jgi:hypothetical protein